MDYYTPCASRPTEAHARRRKNGDGQKHSSHEAVLDHFSSFLSHQEARMSQLMHNFDISLESDAGGDRIGMSEPDASVVSSCFSNMTQSSRASMPPPLRSENKQRSAPRPGRLSPSTMQMILSSNLSTVSGISSAADTSYDSDLYQWLGVRRDVCGLESSPSVPIFCNESFDMKDINTKISMSMTSPRAYSQPCPESQIVFPLSPPATACPPFSDTLRDEQTGGLIPRLLDPSSPHQLLPESTESSPEDELRDFAGLDSFVMPTLSNNLSLQHYMPSASVLGHFQRVIDELRGLYVPNDVGNNAPTMKRMHATMFPCVSLPTSQAMSPSRQLSHLTSRNPSVSVTQLEGRHLQPAPPKDGYTPRHPITTRELYTEMAVMLFTQVTNDEAQITNLRNLVNRLDILVGRKRKVALVIGSWGRERD